jgi:hypothetical protein
VLPHCHCGEARFSLDQTAFLSSLAGRKAIFFEAFPEPFTEAVDADVSVVAVLRAEDFFGATLVAGFAIGNSFR